jgi:cell division protein FtsQ
MGTIQSVSQSELARRRRQLRRNARIKAFQRSWQLLAVSALTGGLIWATTLPGWVIRQPTQVAIVGNKLLSAQAIRSLVPLSYPQFLLEIRPQGLAEALESSGPIAMARVSRQLFPPQLRVEVQERYPVAIATYGNSASESVSTESRVGLLDENGVWMPLESYTAIETSLQLPSLKAIGNPAEYRPYWAEVYRAIRQTPLKIHEIDWQDPSNLILKTEIGPVHLGPYSSRFATQLNVLAQMRQLPDRIDPGQIAYIDLSDPDSPSLQRR